MGDHRVRYASGDDPKKRSHPADSAGPSTLYSTGTGNAVDYILIYLALLTFKKVKRAKSGFYVDMLDGFARTVYFSWLLKGSSLRSY